MIKERKVGGCTFGTGSLQTSFADFESTLRAEGFDEVLDKCYPPAAIIETHVHSFAAKALVVSGEMWMTVDGRTQHLPAGSTFELEPLIEHSERYGSHGATYWVGRRKMRSHNDR